MAQTLNVALIQSEIYWENIEANLAMFEEKIWDISEAVDLIILPEMFNTGFSMKPQKLAEVAGLKTQKWLVQMAAQKKALIGGSYIFQDKENYYNRFVFVFPDGQIQFYDKRHLFSLAEEEKHFTAGQSRLIVEFKGWKICPMICYDLRFPIWSRNQIKNGIYDYDLLIYSANWPKPRIHAWNTLLQARAIENQSYVIGVNRTGRDGDDYEYVGSSAVYDHSGEEQVKMDDRENIVVQSLQKDAMDQFRTKYPFLMDADRFTVS